MSITYAHKLPYWQVALVLLVGAASCFVPLMVTAVWAAVVLATVVAAIFERREQVWYGLAASPFLEVWSRMVKGAVMVDEIGKYYVLLCIVLLWALHLKNDERHQPVHKVGGLIIALLIPGLIVNIPGFDREQWVFNILPTLELGALLMLVSRERWNVERFARTVQIGAAPILFIILYLVIRTPSLSDVNFSLGANFKAAGGGTNQVATVLGLGILYIMILLLLKRPPVAKWICYALIAFLFFRSFLTFSRGGVFAAVASVLLAMGYAMISNRKTFFRYSIVLVVFTLVGILAFDKVDEITGHKLSQRYRGETSATLSGEQEKTLRKVTSGRSTLIIADWEIFKSYPFFGVGPGGAKELRNNLGAHRDSAAHTEFTRLLSEHGLGGLLTSLSLLLFPIYWMQRQKYRLWKGISAALFCMAVLTATHSAMRSTTTIVCYALAAVPVFVANTRYEQN